MRAADELFDIGPRHLGELGSPLVAVQLPGRADRAQQRQAEGTRTDPGLQHAGTREDVGAHQDLRGVLGVDHRCLARHRDHVFVQQRPEDQVLQATDRGDHHTFGLPDDVVVRQPALGGVKGLARLQQQRLAVSLGVGERDPLAGAQRPGVDAGIGRRVEFTHPLLPSVRARSGPGR
ncbi:hypothetical protein SDC9_165810 [bioreactor metagenome]|uniref:Uncharacterized protein n=1 Tax=bioreactor metagenome TaxID=1076179 RepID=A0A645FXS5_9ZZZZ